MTTENGAISNFAAKNLANSNISNDSDGFENMGMQLSISESGALTSEGKRYI